MSMNTPNAFGFIATGLIMESLSFLPAVTGCRELWLLLMGGLLIVVGATTLAYMGWLQVAPHLVLVTQTVSDSVSTRRAEAREQDAATVAGRVQI